MAKIAMYNAKGKKDGDIELNDAVFGVAPKQSVVHQVFVALMANQRQPWAHTKDKSEVRGGGRKPWRQKGTGRARHGSIRSPLWAGGGVTFGPLNSRNYKQKINKKMNQKAVRMCLTDKVQDEKFVVVSELPTDGKTATVVAMRAALPGYGKTTLVLTAEKNQEVMRAAENLDKFDVQIAQDVNVKDLLNHQYIIASKGAVEVLEKRLA